MTEIIAVVVTPDGLATKHTMDSHQDTSHNMQQLVGGWIEAIGLPNGTLAFRQEGWTCYVNEEGKIHGLDPNERATIAWAVFGHRFIPGDFCAGTAVFVGAPDQEGYDTTCPEFIINYFNLKDN